MPGPVPKRSNQRLSKDKSRNDSVEIVEGIKPSEDLKSIDENWNQTMTTWFQSLLDSGQSRFYQASDWSTARMWCEIITREMDKPEGVSASMMSQFTVVANSLLTTEGSRRRARLEMLAPEVEKEIKDTIDSADSYIDSITQNI